MLFLLVQKKEIFLKFLQNKDPEVVKSTVNTYFKELMVFYNDEIMQENLMEKKFYGTNYGGDKFYSNIDALLEENNLEILELYLLSLKIGFCGSSDKKRKAYIEKLEKLFEPLSTNMERKQFISGNKTFFANWWKVLGLAVLLVSLIEIYYFASFLIIKNFAGALLKV